MIAQIEQLFGPDSWIFTWDLKDGYFHLDMHQDCWTYLCFEWEGRLLHFAQCPNGIASGCWAFTKVVGAAVDYLRSQGLRCLKYIDDGIGGADSYVESRRLSLLTAQTLTDLGWVLNWVKCSSFLMSLNINYSMLILCFIHMFVYKK